MNPDITSNTKPLIPQPGRIAPNTSHVHMYIHTYMKKREKGNNTTATHITIYDKENFTKLQEIAIRNKTNIASILNNFIDVLVNHFDDKPQTLDSFLDPDYIPCPTLLEPRDKIIEFIKKQDNKTLDSLDLVLYQAHVYCRVLASNPEKRKLLEGLDYVSLWRNYYR